MIQLIESLPICLSLSFHLSFSLCILFLFLLSFLHECQWIIVIIVSTAFLDSTSKEVILVILICEGLLYSRTTSHSKIIKFIQVINVVLSNNAGLWPLCGIDVFSVACSSDFRSVLLFIWINFLLSRLFVLVPLLNLSLFALNHYLPTTYIDIFIIHGSVGFTKSNFTLFPLTLARNSLCSSLSTANVTCLGAFRCESGRWVLTDQVYILSHIIIFKLFETFC